MKKVSLEGAFAVCIALGVLLFLVSPISYRYLACSVPQQNIRPINGYEHTYGKEESAKNVHNQTAITTSREQEENSNTVNETASTRNENNVSNPLCGDVRVTDIAIVFFTYCLVIVGWFQIKITEKNIKELERAHIFCGPVNPVLLPTGGTRITFTVANYGKTTGIVREICYTFSPAEPIGNKPNYPGAHFFRTDSAIKPGYDGFLSGLEFLDSPLNGQHFVTGYLIYEDVSGLRHINRFSNRIIPGQTACYIAGPSEWSEYE